MCNLTQFGMSAEAELLENFDRLMAGRKYTTRSEALCDLMRDALARARTAGRPEQKAQAVGSLTLIYDHRAADLNDWMAEMQHRYQDLVVSVLHIHADRNDCMDVIAPGEPTRDVPSLAELLPSLEGVKRGQLFVTLPSEMVNGSAAPTKKSCNPMPSLACSNS